MQDHIHSPKSKLMGYGGGSIYKALPTTVIFHSSYHQQSTVTKNHGIIAVPDISYRRLSSNDQFLVLATDGVRSISFIQKSVQQNKDFL